MEPTQTSVSLCPVDGAAVCNVRPSVTVKSALVGSCAEPGVWRGSAFLFVDHFSQLPHDVGFKVKSEKFILCDRAWTIDLYPGGDSVKNAGRVGIHLVPYPQGQVRYEKVLSIAVDTPNNPFRKVVRWSRSFGPEKLDIKRSNLCTREMLLYAIGAADEVDFELELQLNGSPPRRSDPATGALHRDLANLWTSGSYCSDLVLRADGRDFKVHRVVLCARSEVFRAMLAGGFAEASAAAAAPLEIHEVDRKTFELLLQYIYTGEVDLELTDPGSLVALLHAADRFAIHDLSDFVQRRMGATLSPDTVADYSNAASALVGACWLRTAVVLYAQKNGLLKPGAKEVEGMDIGFVVEHAATLAEEAELALDSGIMEEEEDAH